MTAVDLPSAIGTPSSNPLQGEPAGQRKQPNVTARAADHHEAAARHHAAKHHEHGNHEKASHHAHTAQGHLHHATHHAAEAAQKHAEHYGKDAVIAV